MGGATGGAFERRIGRALSAVRSRPSVERSISLDDLRIVVFSDLHRGQGDGADDFLPCRPAYHAALAYYLAAGYELFLLGDIEELWECRPSQVHDVYKETLELEAAFARQGRMQRFWGNHDDLWASPDAVLRHLAGVLRHGDAADSRVPVAESLRLEVRDGRRRLGEVLFVHGHQGTGTSDRFAAFSRAAVRFLWRPFQRLTRVRLSTPAADYVLRRKHEMAMYRWAANQGDGLVLVAGHTHQPVFSSRSHSQSLQAELRELRAKLEGAGPMEAPTLRRAVGLKAAELEWVLARTQGHPLETPNEVKPCYFNAGCCSYADGDITGLELADGAIQLVRWPDRDGRPRPEVLRRAPLDRVLGACC